jgi:hypothetical protein
MQVIDVLPAVKPDTNHYDSDRKHEKAELKKAIQTPE